MRFGYGQILLYLGIFIAAAIAFYIWAERGYKKISTLFAAKEVLGKIDPSYNIRKRRLQVFLNLAALLLIGFSLSRPQWGLYWKERAGKGLDVLIALDTSRSMLATDVEPDRLTFAKEEIRDFVKGLKGDRVGLIVFSGDTFLYCPLTMDHAGFFLILDNVDTASIARGGTSFTKAIEEAIRDFKPAVTEQRILIIMSDGEGTEGDLEEAIEKAKKENIEISCVGLGTEEGSLIPYVDKEGKGALVRDEEGKPVRSVLDEETLEKIAAETGGIYVRADPARGALEIIYEERLAGLKKQRTEEMLAKSYKERFQFPLGLALLALLVDLVLTMVNKDEKA